MIKINTLIHKYLTLQHSMRIQQQNYDCSSSVGLHLSPSPRDLATHKPCINAERCLKHHENNLAEILRASLKPLLSLLFSPSGSGFICTIRPFRIRLKLLQPSERPQFPTYFRGPFLHGSRSENTSCRGLSNLSINNKF